MQTLLINTYFQKDFSFLIDPTNPEYLPEIYRKAEAKSNDFSLHPYDSF